MEVDEVSMDGSVKGKKPGGGGGGGGGGGCIEFPLQYLSLYILIWILSIPVLRWLFVLIENLIDLNILL